MENVNKEYNALNFATQFQISVNWLCQSENDKTDSLQKFKNENAGVSVFNPAVLIAYGYMCFVVPRESALFEHIQVDEKLSELADTVEIVENTYNEQEGLLFIIKHIRNALAHANFTYEEDRFVFKDENRSGSCRCEIRITMSGFGSLIDEIYYKQKKEYFNR